MTVYVSMYPGVFGDGFIPCFGDGCLFNHHRELKPGSVYVISSEQAASYKRALRKKQPPPSNLRFHLARSTISEIGTCDLAL